MPKTSKSSAIIFDIWDSVNSGSFSQDNENNKHARRANAIIWSWRWTRSESTSRDSPRRLPPARCRQLLIGGERVRNVYVSKIISIYCVIFVRYVISRLRGNCFRFDCLLLYYEIRLDMVSLLFFLFPLLFTLRACRYFLNRLNTEFDHSCSIWNSSLSLKLC